MSAVDDKYIGSPWSFVNQGRTIKVFYDDAWLQLPSPWLKVKYHGKPVGKKGSKSTMPCVVWSGPTKKLTYRLAWKKLSIKAIGLGTLTVMNDGLVMLKAKEYKTFLSKFS
jgi:hypothetical protein